MSEIYQSFASGAGGFVGQFTSNRCGSAADARDILKRRPVKAESFRLLPIEYAYRQITDDSGQNPQPGCFRSRVFGVGPQIGYIFPIADMQGFRGLKVYGEMDAANRPSGWNTWLTFSISQAAPTAVTPTSI